jgi:hypothetical protein
MSTTDLKGKISQIKEKLAHKDQLGTPTEIYSRITG